MIEQHVSGHGWRVIHAGVYALNAAPLSRQQLWMAATLTAPGTVVSHASAGACLGIRPWTAAFETVTRPGSGGIRRHPGLVVCRSATLTGDTMIQDGIPITTATRTLIDLAPHPTTRALGRALRESLRLRMTTTPEVLRALGRHRGRRGTAHMLELVTRYAGLPFGRARSDAEILAYYVLREAGVPLPRLNVKVAGLEADLVWLDRRLIIEIDGPQFHQISSEDMRKQSLWERAGFTVRRLSSDVVYNDPDRLIALVRR
ncbi:MAG: hypothetical protein QOD53_507 [Thermoleophilaceae bacterium]|nr:hypothetical protein [Thermoleophilaceae bacterium]